MGTSKYLPMPTCIEKDTGSMHALKLHGMLTPTCTLSLLHLHNRLCVLSISHSSLRDHCCEHVRPHSQASYGPQTQ